ncbi:stage III sporulation protein AE [Clostridium tetanomorphum]|uniref:Stage III sporulation protein AE n=1 Tax=Clostridium tetanomorphum TaxID=1553 RepID=A0A923E7B6_CLOTT|nr:stage III sporulation protein AE [Clostridium tetanomorphum]KAJ51484.1 stage III sporulation protein AE [Clostridium tetanomorphum DSM 665]MBC2396577.1 stage III sporulation protein AE [Clostridium tetanomorphum]MBP1863905.1 stage III sporulation protein AE [Clostridium tetanomorphum]NRS84983.1 stage III sporulation protein AE [Clostridium tetanomorphum]NRZ98199.1 stage III sporulation protein AE [Clostridium tetanomorphum]
MKKWIIILLTIFITIFFTPYNVQASSNEEASYKSNKEVEQLYDYITNMKSEHELMKDMDIKNYVNNYMKKGEGKFSIKKFSKAIISYLLRETALSIKLMSILVIISIICALITNLEKAFTNENLSNIAYFACYSLIIIIMARSFYIGVDLARDTINKMSDFMLALIPVILMLLVSIGGIAEAAVMDPIIIGTINISARLFSNILIPLISMTFVLQFVNNITEEYKIDKLTKLLNQIVLWGQGILMTIFIGIMTVRGIASKTLDQVVAKTAKYAVDNFVPIVGKCLSDAVATVAGYSLLLKNSLSSIGLVILILIVILPVLKILVTALLYKLTAALIEPIGDKRLVNCIGSAGDSLILITSCLICVSVMFFIMICIVAAGGKIAIGG